MSNVANTEQYDAWNGESGARWVADPDRRDRAIAAVADAMLDVAALVPGERVLDVGCGCGATTLSAAAAVAPNGAAIGVDIAEPMLAIARERADEAGVGNVSFVHGDAQVHTFGPAAFDVAVSRFGTMFFADVPAAFANIASTLGPGGRLCIATWQPLADNEWLAVPFAALLRFGTMDAPADGPGPFALSDPAVVESVLDAAGFDAVNLAAVTVPLLLGADTDEATAHLAETGFARTVLDTVSEGDRPAALAAMSEVLADHVTGTGVQLDGAIWIATARIEG